MLNEEILFDII